MPCNPEIGSVEGDIPGISKSDLPTAVPFVNHCKKADVLAKMKARHLTCAHAHDTLSSWFLVSGFNLGHPSFARLGTRSAQPRLCTSTGAVACGWVLHVGPHVLASPTWMENGFRFSHPPCGLQSFGSRLMALQPHAVSGGDPSMATLAYKIAQKKTHSFILKVPCILSKNRRKVRKKFWAFI